LFPLTIAWHSNTNGKGAYIAGRTDRTPFSVRVRDDAMRKRLQVAAKKLDVTLTGFMRYAVLAALEASERA
jgi:hypothetical protein